MSRECETRIASLSKSRILQHREEAKNNVKLVLAAIERSADPLIEDTAQRPFGIPLGRSPYDIWHHILDEIIDPDDIFKLWEMCPIFREILRSTQKYIQARLPQIVQLILDQYPKLLLDNGHKTVGPRNVSPSKLMLLNLRLVSRQCKNSVEAVFQQTAGIYDKKLYLSLQIYRDAQNLIDDIQAGKIMVDSFFPQNVEVDEEKRFYNTNNDEFREEFPEAVGNLLELIGRRMKVFSYKTKRCSQDVYDKLSSWVVHTPNLELIELYPISISENDWFYGRFPLEDRRHSRLPIFEDLPAFPNCPRLTSFHQKREMLPMPYFLCILKANPLMKMLSLAPVGRSIIEEYDVPSAMKVRMQNFERLHIPLFPFLRNYLHFRLPLKEIIFLERHSASWEVCSKELFAFLHQFRDSLEHLEMQHTDFKVPGDYFLDLPHLKIFKWWCERPFKNDLRFLLLSERLEMIEMTVWQATIQFEHFSQELLKKVASGFDGISVWDVYPRLKTFRVDFRAYNTTAIVKSSGKIEVRS